MQEHMATLSTEDIQTLTDALARMGLVKAHEPPPRLTALAGGVSSLIARADTARGPVCIKRALARLKVASAWYAPVHRNAAEVAWLSFVATVQPQAAPTVLGQDAISQSFAMQWLAPDHYPVWKAQLRDGIIDIEFARQLGATVAAIHAASARQAHLANQFDHRSDFDALRLDPYFMQAAKAHPDCALALHALRAQVQKACIALMHGDVSPKNILRGPQGPVLLDAECACWGDPAFDLAFVLNHLLLKTCWRPAHHAALIECGRTLSEAYLRAVDWEPAAQLEARVCALLPGLLLARIDGKSPVEYLDQASMQDRVRGFARQLLLEPVLRLAQIVLRWEEVFFYRPGRGS
jgi:aminoglycoside phosphotransferase (APT) family kinase protein